MRLKVVVAGPGAVGQVVGGKLALAGHTVTFLGREESARIADLTRHGVRVNNLWSPEQSFTVRVPVTARLDGAPPADLVLLTTKTYSTDHVLPILQPVVAAQTILMSLQNGVESAAKLQDAFQRGIVLGSFCGMGVKLLPSGIVEQISPERVVVGALTAGDHVREVAMVLSAFQGAGIPIAQSDDIQRDLWIKFLRCVGIFQWCAIEDMSIGELLADDTRKHRTHATMAEVVQIAQAHGVRVTNADIEPQIATVHTNFAANIPSLLEDLRAGQPLELAAFGGFIVQQGRAHGIPTPWNDTIVATLEPHRRGDVI